jgi:tetratricopeptide (TPR) repeat protein
MRRSLQFRIGRLIALSLAASGVACAQSPCTPPESMKAKFAGTPETAALNELGVWFGEQKNYTCAANAFATSLQMDSKQKDMPHVAFMFGASLYLAGDIKEAIAAMQEAEKFGYRDIKLHLVLAEALDSTHATAEAEAEWRAALEIDPEYSDALDKLSNDLIADDNFQGVIELLDTPRLSPQRTVQQCINLDQAYAKQGKLGDAARVLRDGINTYPDSLPLAEKLAGVLTQLGKKEEAARVLAIAHARNVNSSAPEVH